VLPQDHSRNVCKVTALTIRATLKGALAGQDPKQFLFFTDTEGGRRAGSAFLELEGGIRNTVGNRSGSSAAITPHRPASWAGNSPR
jgi:hypothetical protein